MCCDHLYHQKCTPLSIKEYNCLIKTDGKATWYCPQCVSSIFPFHSVGNQVFIELFSFNQNISCFCSMVVQYCQTYTDREDGKITYDLYGSYGS